MKNQPETFWAWLAGFIDGDGCLVLYKGKTKNSLYPRIQIGQMDKSVLDFIKSKMGCGCVCHNKHTNYIIWSSNQVKKLLLRTLPYLQIKKAQGELLLRACRLNNFCVKRNSQPFFLDAYHQELKEIDKKLRLLKRVQVKRVKEDE